MKRTIRLLLSATLIASMLPPTYASAASMIDFGITQELAGLHHGAMGRGDFDRDGTDDLVMNGYDENGNGHIYFYHGNIDGTFAAPVDVEINGVPFQQYPFRSISLAVGDMNGDDLLDIVSADKILRGDGRGHFQLSGSYGGYEYDNQIALGDLNNDGLLDIVTGAYKYLSPDYQSVRIDPILFFSGGAAIADLNNDGAQDIVVSIPFHDGFFVYTPSRTFVSLNGMVGGQFVPADLTNDGRMDLVTFGLQGATVLQNTGISPLTFSQASVPFAGRYGGISAFDSHGLAMNGFLNLQGSGNGILGLAEALEPTVPVIQRGLGYGTNVSFVTDDRTIVAVGGTEDGDFYRPVGKLLVYSGPGDRDTRAPVVRIATPRTGAALDSNAILVEADAYDNRGVSRVDFYADGQPIGTDAVAPYNVKWKAANGLHTLTAKAFDAAGNNADSVAVQVEVTTSFAISLPLDGASVDGVIDIETTAIDAASGIARVDFSYRHMRGYSSGSIASIDTPPFKTRWDTSSLVNGPVRIDATAYTRQGEIKTDSVTVTIARPDVTPPTVAITTPTADATVNGFVIIQGTASDDNRVVTKTEFYADGALIGTSNIAPYNAAWNTTVISLGTHELAMKAYDDSGNVGISPAITVTVTAANIPPSDTTAPTAVITAPSDGATVSGVVMITGDASDNVGVTRTEFFKDGIFIGTDSDTPYTASWNTTGEAAGAHQLVMKAYDAAGNVGTSTVVTVTFAVLPPPDLPPGGGDPGRPFPLPPSRPGPGGGAPFIIVQITAPSNGAVLSLGSAVEIKATAQAVALVNSVEFYVNGKSIGLDATAPYAATWTPPSTGDFTLEAIANDNKGHSATDSIVVHVPAPITIDNTVPSVFITDPKDESMVFGNVTIVATASDNFGVAKVEFRVDDVLIDTDNEAPYSTSWDSRSAVAGAHQIWATGIDRAGNRMTHVIVVYTLGGSGLQAGGPPNGFFKLGAGGSLEGYGRATMTKLDGLPSGLMKVTAAYQLMGAPAVLQVGGNAGVSTASVDHSLNLHHWDGKAWQKISVDKEGLAWLSEDGIYALASDNADAPYAISEFFTFPLPAKDRVSVRVGIAGVDSVHLRIYDAVGREVDEMDVTQIIDNGYEQALNTNLPSGVYFVRCTIKKQGEQDLVGQTKMVLKK